MRSVTLGEETEDGKTTLLVGTTKNCVLSGSFHAGMSFIMKVGQSEMIACQAFNH